MNNRSLAIKQQTVTTINIEDNRKEVVRNMFNNIAEHYDLLNHILSLGIDKRWRKQAVKMLGDIKDKHIVDIATGTGDIAISLCRFKPRKITAIDISEEMMLHAGIKIKEKHLTDVIDLVKGDSENLIFDENTFDGAIMGFGVRNFSQPLKGLKEIYRVLKPEAKIVILEFSLPRKMPGKLLSRFYIRNIVPVFGKKISNNNYAYTYLHDSINGFPAGKEFLALMKEAGFSDMSKQTLTLGLVSIYKAYKKNETH